MSVPIWPATLPQELLVEGYSGELRGNILSTSMDAGPAKRRRRSTSGVKPVSGSQKLTTAELGYLAAFYETTLLDGSLRFRWRDPLVDDMGMLVASISGATANLSLVDGTAFISNPSTDLSDYEYTYIIVTDSAGKKAIGYIKAAGTGETLDTDLLNGWNLTSGWTAAAATINDADTFATAGSGGVYKTLTTAGTLYKLVWDVTTTASYASFTNTTASVVYKAGNGTGYGTANATQNVYIKNTGAGTTDITSMALTKVLTPSSTGVTITSTAGGTTYNWASVEAGFNYNDTSYDIAIYATEMRFAEQPTWTAIEPGLFLVNYKLEILP